ncbi:siderophore-interacting protein [Streptomyces sp. NRRL F-5053]|uniref:siderophore-interacting protein n=1 Tax=Streptomyces sp. NRRL F-5053 TaxID=1463854 RepID=UPI0004C49994|nr:siderophore-interacting protein [Streptomyces sp. NRRL F-5053]
MPRIQLPETRRMINLRVHENTRISPHFRRITLAGPELEHLEHSGYDQGVRLFFPREGQEDLRMPNLAGNAWMVELMLLPKSRRPWVRNYTVRRLRPEQHQLDIEFAVHGTGPASAWATRARPGDPAGIFDLGRTYLPPRHADRQLLVADESALPAVLSILDDAPPSLRAEVFLEVPGTDDIRTGTGLDAREGLRIHWLPRNDDPRTPSIPGRLALDAVRRADLPEAPGYAWVAGEAGLATGVRRHLVGERGWAKSDVAFVGYWRTGRSSPG